MMNGTRKSGFTLLEVIFATGIFSLGATLLVSLTVGTVGFSHEEQMQNAVELEKTLMLDYYGRDILEAAAVNSSFPTMGPGTKGVVFKVPQFDEYGVHTCGEFDYVVYAYTPKTGRVSRTVYDDELGTMQLAKMEIPAANCNISYFADGKNLSTVKEFAEIQTLQLSAKQDETEREFEYSRRFVTASTLRNPNK